VRAAGSLVVLRRTSVEIVEDSAVNARPTPAPLVTPSARVLPRLSCIMPTCDRRPWVPHAIRHFLAQNYVDRELVIVDDGKDVIADLVPPDARIRYLRLEGRRSVGEKRNIACAAATGEFVVHWDDDDWSAPSRLGIQLAALERSGAAIGGLATIHYHDPTCGKSWQYRYPAGARPWVGGNTLIFRKALWSRQPFTAVDVGEDARFVWAHASAGVHAHAEGGFFVAMIHGTNVGKKHVQQRFWHPIGNEVIRGLMGDDFDEYAELVGRDSGRTRTG
jgi:glycosyltransferase involved in cell wall biosynthesis